MKKKLLFFLNERDILDLPLSVESQFTQEKQPFFRAFCALMLSLLHLNKRATAQRKFRGVFMK